MIAESLAPLGEEYVGIVRRGIADRWVDGWANIGKGAGRSAPAPAARTRSSA